jgi:hypothetical protein
MPGVADMDSPMIIEPDVSVAQNPIDEKPVSA